MLILLFSLLFSGPAYAVSLYWDNTSDGQLNVEFSETQNGPWSFIRRIPAHPPFYGLEPGKFGYYRLTVPGGPSSNTARYSMDIVSEPQPSNITAKQLDADHIEITGLACVSLKTTGSGLKRVVECIH